MMPHMYRLLKTMPNALTAQAYGVADFISKAQMQLTINDDDSYLAALVTLSKFGKHALACGIAESDLYILIAPEHEDAAILFYNRLPRRMRRYKGECAEVISKTPLTVILTNRVKR